MEIPKTWYSHEWESSKKDWRKRISILSECVIFLIDSDRIEQRF